MAKLTRTKTGKREAEFARDLLRKDRKSVKMIVGGHNRPGRLR